MSEEQINRLLTDVEPEKISREVTEKEIVLNKLNSEESRSFDTLYLPKKQETLLFKSLEMFQKNKEKRLKKGLSDKFNVLLYGEPGCGKTTTIKTIASYLNRDIIYFNIHNMGDKELLEMVHHISEKHKKKSIMVFEDIDAMTDVVFDRTLKESPLKLPEFDRNITFPVESNENHLTLSTLLNLLDGSLTMNDSMVIFTTNYADKLDKALTRAMRINLTIELKKADHLQISRIYENFMERPLSPETLQKIPEYEYTPAEIIQEIVNRLNIIDEETENETYVLEKFMRN